MFTACLESSHVSVKCSVSEHSHLVEEFPSPRRQRASLVAQLVKNLPAVQETRVRFQGLEDPLEKEMATHSSILAWKSHGQRSPAGYCPWGRKSQI